ncbi:hypothetical protein NEUTE2DRAFT_54039 [Neurospora tetrasperma FGSC 2509]|nr:hypothetical protein NEUTE2DRAFT_54039 [Neurospora tetrasperma FGSC 2509]
MDRPLGADHVVMATAGLKATPTRGKYSTVLDSLDMVYKCVNDCMQRVDCTFPFGPVLVRPLDEE